MKFSYSVEFPIKYKCNNKDNIRYAKSQQICSLFAVRKNLSLPKEGCKHSRRQGLGCVKLESLTREQDIEKEE